MFRGNEVSQIAVSNIFQKVLFRILFSSNNLALAADQRAARQYFRKDFPSPCKPRILLKMS